MTTGEISKLAVERYHRQIIGGRVMHILPTTRCNRRVAHVIGRFFQLKFPLAYDDVTTESTVFHQNIDQISYSYCIFNGSKFYDSNAFDRQLNREPRFVVAC